MRKEKKGKKQNHPATCPLEETAAHRYLCGLGSIWFPLVLGGTQSKVTKGGGCFPPKFFCLFVLCVLVCRGRKTFLFPLPVLGSLRGSCKLD